MTAPTLDTIADALEARLRALMVPAYAGGFRAVERYVPDRKLPLSDAVYKQVGSKFPAALLWLEEGTAKTTLETTPGDSETYDAVTWSVLVCSVDVRSAKATTEGTPFAPGLYGLASLVQDSLNSLPIDGLWRNRRVRYRDTRWSGHEVLGRFYCLAVRFDTPRIVGNAPAPEDAFPYRGTTGRLHLPDVTDPRVDPIDTFKDQ